MHQPIVSISSKPVIAEKTLNPDKHPPYSSESQYFFGQSYTNNMMMD